METREKFITENYYVLYFYLKLILSMTFKFSHAII